MNNLKFVMIGSVDHGKSTLIGRLLFDTCSLPEEKLEEIKRAAQEQGEEMEFAYVVDHLEEERRGHLTIDTAQTFFKTSQREYVIIDAPGHKEFLKNMITGASQAEAAVLIVDAHEGIKEQTRRHAYIVKLLGLEQLIVAINKMDLINFSSEKFINLKKDLDIFLGKINISPHYVIPISAKKGDNVSNKSGNMPWYEGVTFLKALDSFRNLLASTDKPMRFPVQDLFKFNGRNVLLGRVEAGIIHSGEELVFLPSGRKAKVKSIEVFLRDNKKQAEAGESIALMLEPDLPVTRGEIACPLVALSGVTGEFKASVFWMSPTALDKNEMFLFRCATEETPAKIKRIDERINSSTLKVIGENASKLRETEVGEVVIVTKKPVVVESFYDTKELGRFVLARGSEVVAGGIITHPRA